MDDFLHQLQAETSALSVVGPTRAFQLAMACIAGGVLGADRRVHGSAAGVRTCALVCMGAALYIQAGQTLGGPGADPVRMGGQIATGIGFLGAGAILRVGQSVSGLTSAAVVWFLGAVGIVIGSGYPLSGLAVSLTALLVLRLLRAIEARLPQPPPARETLP